MCNVLLSALALLCLLLNPAAAQSQAESGEHMLCDTQAQIEQVVANFSRGGMSAEEAAAPINAEQKANACATVTVAFARTREVSSVRVPRGVMHFIEIVVVGAMTNHGWTMVSPPATQFIAILEKQEPV